MTFALSSRSQHLAEDAEETLAVDRVADGDPEAGRVPSVSPWAPNGRRHRIEACESHRPPPGEGSGPTA